MKLSVLMITYNQEKYVAQALDSILMQEVDFPYEIVIGEDCSTDGTRDIILRYQERYPEKIRSILTDRNVGMLQNFARTFRACSGQYVAILEGDDFWTSPKKLQKQVAFLDSHRECSLCFHTTEVFYEEKDASSYLSPSCHREFSTIEDLLENNFIQTCSVMFRNKLFGDLPEWFCSGAIGDYPLHLLNAAHGSIGFIDEVMGAYRVHSAGVWSMQMEKNFLRNTLSTIQMYRNVDAQLGRKYHSIIVKKIYEHELALYKWYTKKRAFKAFIQAAHILLRYPLLLLREKLRYEAQKRAVRRHSRVESINEHASCPCNDKTSKAGKA